MSSEAAKMIPVMYVFVQMCAHICVSSEVEKKSDMVYLFKNSACSPSEQIGCVSCQPHNYLLSAASGVIKSR